MFQFQRLGFSDLNITTQTVIIKLDVSDISLSKIHKTIAINPKFRTKENQKFKNQYGFYVDIGDREIYCHITRSTIGCRGCKSIMDAIKASRIIIEYLNNYVYRGYIIPISIQEVMTNLKFNIGEELNLKRIYNHFKDIDDYHSSYIPSYNPNLYIKHPLDDHDEKDMTITITRLGVITLSGRRYKYMKRIYEKFMDDLMEILPYN